MSNDKNKFNHNNQNKDQDNDFSALSDAIMKPSEHVNCIHCNKITFDIQSSMCSQCSMIHSAILNNPKLVLKIMAYILSDQSSGQSSDPHSGPSFPFGGISIVKISELLSQIEEIQKPH